MGQVCYVINYLSLFYIRNSIQFRCLPERETGINGRTDGRGDSNINPISFDILLPELIPGTSY